MTKLSVVLAQAETDPSRAAPGRERENVREPSVENILLSREQRRAEEEVQSRTIMSQAL